MADPRFFSPIKTQLQNAARNANAARTGGPVIIDKFLIPADPKEYRWLTNNMNTINSVYDRQRKINEDT